MDENLKLEPLCKKAKLAETIDNILKSRGNLYSIIDNILNSKENLEGILGDEYINEIPLKEFYVGKVKCVRDLSKIILILNEKIPLKEFSHLKRARKQEILLIPANYIESNTETAVETYIKENLNELKDSFEYIKIISVPSIAPKLTFQYSKCVKVWPCNFHPNKYLEKVYNGDVFNEKEIKIHRQYMSMAFEVAGYYLKERNVDLEQYDILSTVVNASVVVDPGIESVVAVAFDNRDNHPIQHSAMLAIDNVAKTQNGGAWESLVDTEENNLKGIGCMKLLLHLKEKYLNVKFGAKSYVSKNDLEEQKLSASECPYLCTGYHIYLIKEPCVMCSMALVHARINKVFFYKKHGAGGLCSKTKLHCIQSLNHHFEVYTTF